MILMIHHMSPSNFFYWNGVKIYEEHCCILKNVRSLKATEHLLNSHTLQLLHCCVTVQQQLKLATSSCMVQIK